MQPINVPEWVRQQLAEDEVVLSRLSVGMAELYATDKRLLRFRGRSEYEALAYSDVSIVRRRYGSLLGVARAVLTLVGAFALLMAFIALIGPTFTTSSGIYRTKGSLAEVLLLMLTGLMGLFYAWYVPDAYYQIEAPGLDGRALRKWRIARSRWSAERMDRFARVVQERSAEEATNG